MRGSLPPGTVRLAWAYDLPIDARTMRIPVALPLRFFGLQVFSEAPEGLTLDVTGMPPAQRLDNEGQAIWLTQVRHGPTDPTLESITVVVSGIPGPGPVRWIAVVLALLLLAGGIFFGVRRADERDALARARQRRREELLEEARELERDLEAGEVGPEFRQKRRAEIVRELAVLLHEEEMAAARSAGQDASARPAR
jgi:hypothetical protein